MKVTAIRYMADNYAYWVERLGGTIGFLIDAGSSKELLSFFKAKGLKKPNHIFATHKHSDHCGGNLELITKATKVYAGELDAKEVPGCNTPLKDGETLDIDGLKISVFHTPCHTTGHVLYHVATTPEIPSEKPKENIKHSDELGTWVEYSGGINRALFTGDTLFVGGCGRFFEGTGAQMLNIMDKLHTLPDDLLVFCGHEYSSQNAEFGIKVEPHNTSLQAFLKESEKSEEGEFIIPSSIADEKQFNVFMRCRTKEIQSAVGSTDPEFCMNNLREAKNKGVFPLKK